jgi:hypothetical protein
LILESMPHERRRWPDLGKNRIAATPFECAV